MKNVPHLLFVVIGLLLTSHRFRNTVEPVRITVQAKSLRGQLVKLSTPNTFTFEPIDLASTSIDSAGRAVLEIPVTKIMFVNLKVGEMGNTLLLGPGDNIQVGLKGEPATVSFTGKAAKAAIYLQEASVIWHHYEQSGGKHFLQLKPHDFSSRADSLVKAYAKLDHQSTSLASLPQPIQHLLQERNRMQLIAYKLNYSMAMYNPNDSAKAGPLTMASVVKEVPFDAALLKANLYEYGLVLSFWTQAGLYAPPVVGKPKEEVAASQPQLPLLADKQLIGGNYPASIRAFLRARNLYDALNQQGITPMTESLLSGIKKESDYLIYEPTLTQKYNKWLALSAGQPAPDFSGITPEGKTLSLSDLKGKVVYVDVWATWCAPCREEFPQAKKLQSQFAANDQVAFLYVSIDRNQDAWKKLLVEDTAFKGLHINRPPGELFDRFWNAYQFSSIPRYMLIDRRGYLVNANAARPSSGEIAGVIQGLLK